MTAFPGWSADRTLYRSRAIYKGASRTGRGDMAVTRGAVTPQQGYYCDWCIFNICYSDYYSEWDCYNCLRYYGCGF
jgi:hypothetical protein